VTGPADVISLPNGGGALAGIGEKFAPDLHTGTGNFTVPLAVPPGRNGLQPQLDLVYSTGAGNGPFGLGWSLSLPGVSRRTAKGVPRYDEDRDVYVLSGAEDLEPVEWDGAVTRYRPRTEGLFARILRHRGPGDSHWEVKSKDGLVTTYGTPGVFPDDPATVADPADRERVYAWNITRTADPHGNHVAYEYQRDTGGRVGDPHHWDQVYVARIRYADYGPDPANPQYLVSVTFEYEERPDSFSERRAGFEVRTRLRCARVVVRSHTDADHIVRIYELDYADQLGDDSRPQPPNGVSLLARLRVTGHGGDKTESMPPLEFRYSGFEPAKRKFFAAQGAELSARALTDPDLDLVDLSGNGLPDVVQLNGAARRWRNRGDGRFDTPRPLRSPPAGIRLGDPGVRFLDANGDGRADLMVTSGPLAGYFPMRADVGWDGGSFRRFRQAPSFNLSDPEVRLVDLDGDGVTDAIRSGTRLECFFNDPVEGWTRTRAVPRSALASFPDLSFSDPRVRWADFTGDGLHDVSVVYDGNVEYWPSLGLGDWGPRISMRNAPRFPYGYDPKRILIGDVDGDGLADLVYAGDNDVTVWINRGGDAWSDPITVRARGGDTERQFRGTPPVAGGDVRLIDLLGSGIEGVLWSRDARSDRGASLHFLDFTGGRKPYLLEEMDNHIGAVTTVEYAPSTRYYAEDDRRRETRWRTTLPFPVQVVAKATVRDHFSGGTLTTGYRYRHGHWDGAEREFRGFGLVEQRDAETFDDAGPAPSRYAPPTLTRTWFHPGPVGDEFGPWSTPDFANEYWPGDLSVLDPPGLPPDAATPEGRRIRRDALRALRGSVLRTELYAEDGTERESRPYRVTESGYAVQEIDAPPAGAPARRRVFFPHTVAQRTTTWERGEDPMTGFSFTRYTDDTGAFDPYGRPRATTAVACPRGWRSLADRPAERYLATRTRTGYAVPDAPGTYIHDRVAATTTFEITATEGTTVESMALDRAKGHISACALSVIARERDCSVWRPIMIGARHA
jgi:hypothetical protein